jgi:hypothetical protein
MEPKMINPGSDLNDSLDDLLSAPVGEVRKATVNAPADFRSASEFLEPCRKCGGSGLWGGRQGYPCFACKGKGKLSFKTSPEARASARARTETKRVEKAQEDRTWRETHKAEVTWLYAAAERQLEISHKGGNVWNFPIKVSESLSQFGTLTDGQLAAVKKCMERDAERKAEWLKSREADAAAVDTAGIDRLKKAFDTAVANANEKGLSLRSPRITIGGMTISPAKAESKNPGALYVKAGQQYLGKVADGRFFGVRECTDEQKAKVLEFIADPQKAAEAYGQTTGVCCICNATLKSKWKLRGIGPICAEKFGW